jgi:DNA (cytosine-5)-methyltransferase 1
MPLKPRAVEFFSGIGAFAVAARESGLDVVAAFDQSAEANDCYRLNFGMQPVTKNLDSLPMDEIPDAEIWWMSPPCTPYTVRGNQRDLADPRSSSFVRLMSGVRLGKVQHCPETIIVENVSGFASSQARTMFIEAVTAVGMSVEEIDLCPTQFGIPMKRPRRFVVASRHPVQFLQIQKAELRPISSFLDQNPDPALFVEDMSRERFSRSLNVLNPKDPSAIAICFTSGYWKSMRASGSFLQESHTIRRFSPDEILRLMGFPDDYRFPPGMPLQSRLRLLGNSVNVSCLTHVLSSLGYTSKQ